MSDILFSLSKVEPYSSDDKLKSVSDKLSEVELQRKLDEPQVVAGRDDQVNHEKH